MPLYEYECEACHQRFEKIQKFSDPPIDVCAKCGKGPV
jgi:putative FmdB family regulatory protein